MGACKTGDDDKCEVVCQCEDGVQYRGAGFCNRENLRCASGVDECLTLCDANGGLADLCSYIEGQPVGHAAPDIACPGVDPEGSDCDPRPNCSVAPRGVGEPWWLGFVLLFAALRRVRD